MTFVTFRSIDEDAFVLGAERAHLGSLVGEVTQAMLGLESPDLELTRERCWRMHRLLNPTHHLAGTLRGSSPTLAQERADLARFAHLFQICLSNRDPDLLQWCGRPISTFALALNTATAIGGDGLCLAARMEAQCEIHGWVGGENRAWLAEVIGRSVRSGMFRAMLGGPDRSDAGWAAVIKLLEKSRRGEVVTSFSVTDGFPSEYLAGVDEDAYRDLPHEERRRKLWRPSMRTLRERPLLEWKPEGWCQYRFDHGLSVLDLTADDWESRVQDAMGPRGCT